MKSKRKNNTENVKGGSTDPHPKTTLVKVVIHQQKILKVEIANPIKLFNSPPKKLKF